MTRLLLLLVLLRPALAQPGLATLSRCRPGQFQCEPGARCFPREWLCDGHPDCDGGEDERGCGTETPEEPSAAEPSAADPAVTPRQSGTALPQGGAEASATPVPGSSVPSRSQGRTCILIIAALLSVLVAVGSVTVWVLSKAKTSSDILSLEKGSREELMPDKSQTGSFVSRGSLP